ncbi:hypothetical protein CEP54_013948 [Fusarium duplospermum]|uniref:Phosphoglycerate mutase n=1 Tax=Fusarium duplospermum TaxID=1325734 RepID=A0A428NZQ8_9HYPO|nr:hypothetical protein CEP54_013948 [Fusarium duplospermum]
MTTIHILRHGQGRHNVQRGYPYRDPPLTEVGCEQAKAVRRALSVKPDLILVSPMTRTIQTMNIVFGHLFNDSSGNKKVEVQVWPELREAQTQSATKGYLEQSWPPKHRSYQFASGEEADKKRVGVNIDTGLEQDFGPTLLVPKVLGDTARLGA